jgi:hypothetical protein
VEASIVSEMFIGRRGRLRTYLFEVATGLAFPILGIAYLISPAEDAAHSVIGHGVYPLDYMWCAGFIVGGLSMIAGVIAPQVRLRAFGFIMLGTALTMQFLAAVFIRPDLQEGFDLIYALACYARAYLVIKLFFHFTRPDEQRAR